MSDALTAYPSIVDLSKSGRFDDDFMGEETVLKIESTVFIFTVESKGIA